MVDKVLLATTPCPIFAIKVSAGYKPFSEENGQVGGVLFHSHFDCESTEYVIPFRKDSNLPVP